MLVGIIVEVFFILSLLRAKLKEELCEYFSQSLDSCDAMHIWILRLAAILLRRKKKKAIRKQTNKHIFKLIKVRKHLL